MGIRKLAHFSPGRFIFASIFIAISLGTLLLSLPSAQARPIKLFDLIFTATSATCVTGLFTVPLDHFTQFGHAIILLLIQIGGLGLITLTIFLMSLFINLGFATQVMAGKMLDLESWKNIKQFILFIIGLTLIVELIGALWIFATIYHEYAWQRACFLSLFHAINSFCNAGVSLFNGGGLHAYATNYSMLTVTMILMFAGSFGFLTWHEIIHYAQAKLQRKRHPFSLNTKIIIYGSLVLILAGTLVLFIIERNHAFATMSKPLALMNALFHAIASRSTGILTVDAHAFATASLFFILLLAFIGAAPASTGSGIKITTFAVCIATLKAAIADRTEVEIRGRRIAIDQVHKAIAIISLSIFWITFTTFMLLILEQGFTFFELFLETASAFATLGLSTGISAHLSDMGKILIIFSMIIGRIGSLTLVLALKKRSSKTDATEFSYPEERIVLS